MNDKYQNLRVGNRETIANIKQAGNSQAEIAQAIGFSQATVSKDLLLAEAGGRHAAGQAENRESDADDERHQRGNKRRQLELAFH